MKIKFPGAFALLLASCQAALAAPLASTTAVHTGPNASSPTITTLAAGTEPSPAPGAMASTPAGWMAVELAGPFEVYVEKKDLAKSLDVKPGIPMRLKPAADGPVLAVAEKGDKTEITGLTGKWTKLKLEKKLTGYIQVGASPSYTPPIATTPAPAPAPVAANQPALTPAPMSPAPVSPGVYGSAGVGQAAPMLNLGDGGSASLPRQFAGMFVSTRRPFTPRRPYDYALNDNAGKRYAYVDISKLLQTDQIEKYVNHQVVVFGTAKATADGKEFVIQVETLQLR